jgi:uncharacterized membrane protein YphA (DoxX/SURF4 family)
MGCLLLTLDLYFAAVLGVAGLTKIAAPQRFSLILERQGIWPSGVIKKMSYLVPGGEIVLGSFLVTGAFRVILAILMLALFVCFLVIHLFLFQTGRRTSCGCLGLAQLVNVNDVATAAIFASLATGHFWLVMQSRPIPPGWRLLAVIAFALAGVWLTRATMAQRFRFMRP